MRRMVACFLGTLVVFAGCGGDNKGGGITQPSGATVTGLTISPATDLLKINAAETFTLTAAMSDGSSRAVTGTWASDAAAVAAIDSSGRATARASGEATISGDAQGTRATRRLRVVPDYQGDWRGGWALTTCSADGDWARANVCQDAPIGSLSAFRLTLTQTRDTVAGNVDFDQLPGPVQGSIRSSGELEIAGAFSDNDPELPLDVVVSDWQSVTTDNQRMTGQFTITLSAIGIQGALRVGGQLRSTIKSAAAAAADSTHTAHLWQAVVGKLKRKK